MHQAGLVAQLLAELAGTEEGTLGLGRRMAWSGVVALLVLSMPIVSAWIVEALDRSRPGSISPRFPTRRRSSYSAAASGLTPSNTAALR